MKKDRKVTIIMYHYVRDLKNSKFPRIKGLDLSLFVEQIEYLIKNYNIVTMEEVINSIFEENKLPNKAALLTFDDGYIDHFLNVFPILDKYKIQGSFYVPAKIILEHTVLSVNKIHFILASVEDKSIIIASIKKLLQRYQEEYGLNSFDYYYKKLATDKIYERKVVYDSEEVIFIKRLLQVELVEKLRDKIVDELFIKFIGMSQSNFSRELYLNKEQLITMHRHGMHIGCHGYGHYWWNHLTKQELINELNLSINFLTEIGIDMNNLTACYPYSGYNNQVIRMLNTMGFKLAMTAVPDIASTNRDTRFEMSRLDTNNLPKDRFSNVNDWFLKH
jgi:peptidoglycan/xylan/chitin deacetylase (PgdA/CDA1 family)